jgi:hypothetical protein
VPGVTEKSQIDLRTGKGTMKHFYRDVPGLGNVAVSRHAQSKMEADGISQEMFDRALLNPAEKDLPEGNSVVLRRSNGIQIVVLLNPTPNRGAKLVKTVYKMLAQAKPI